MCSASVNPSISGICPSSSISGKGCPVLFAISIACNAVLPLSTAVGFMPHRLSIPCNALRFVPLSLTIKACRFRSRSGGTANHPLFFFPLCRTPARARFALAPRIAQQAHVQVCPYLSSVSQYISFFNLHVLLLLLGH